jgi:phosphoenolpyruvate synthase/pyruvate phosphate dikinase
MKWCDQATRMSVRTNADNPEQTQNAIAFGAVGIGSAAPSTCSSRATASTRCAR